MSSFLNFALDSSRAASVAIVHFVKVIILFPNAEVQLGFLDA